LWYHMRWFVYDRFQKVEDWEYHWR
jgi:hypothetical protein